MTTGSNSTLTSAQTWNARFAVDSYLFGTEPNSWLRQNAESWKAGSHILCVADGEGRNSVWLAQQGHRVDAFDISDHAVDKAKRLAKQRNVHVNFAVAGCDDFAWPQDQYDGVAAIFVQFNDPVQRRRLFDRIVGCLKPGGIFVLLGYTPKQVEYRTGGPSDVSHLYTPELLQDELSMLDIQVLKEFEEILDEGTAHSGPSALIGLVGARRKK